ncbi:MAG: 3-dehydroquinate synthase [Eubacteriales bacterium]
MDSLAKTRESINKIDLAMTRLFCERLDTVKDVAAYKAEHSLPIFDAEREAEVIEKNSSLIEDEKIRTHYIEFLRKVMEISRLYQAELYPALMSGIIYDYGNVKKIPVTLAGSSYDIVLGKGVLCDADKYFNLSRRVLILTDSGVPEEYAKAVAEKCKEPYVYTIEAGEASKNLANYEKILSFMAQKRFDRSDCVVAVGGGVVGDLAGFVASSYMRGVDFYNIPTTLLSQVDSSIGGKVAVNLDGYKNTVGAFYQPRCVIIDPELLLTLDIRHIRAGLAESLKMALTHDAELFSMFESGEYLNDISAVIERSLLIKRGVVERDVRESGERKKLNFGHTVGHAIESASGLLHGECVALGMIPMCSKSVRERLIPVLRDIGLYTRVNIDPDTLYSFILHDKKAHGNSITIIYVNEIGKGELCEIPIENIKDVIVPELYGGNQ